MLGVHHKNHTQVQHEGEYIVSLWRNMDLKHQMLQLGPEDASVRCSTAITPPYADQQLGDNAWCERLLRSPGDGEQPSGIMSKNFTPRGSLYSHNIGSSFRESTCQELWIWANKTRSWMSYICPAICCLGLPTAGSSPWPDTRWTLWNSCMTPMSMPSTTECGYRQDESILLLPSQLHGIPGRRVKSGCTTQPRPEESCLSNSHPVKALTEWDTDQW